VLLVFERVLIRLELTLFFFAAHDVRKFNELFGKDQTVLRILLNYCVLVVDDQCAFELALTEQTTTIDVFEIC
jgi:hypothetical protein